ncbi:TonB-dependent receptor plug domain-containing protein [Chitinophaga tropicalis]|uniref:TonB-dependent receptor n=1 Tax=Chitinophaga tropicalis TaxID=2683588 RepID=A0A7K1U749_9BACT|nr:TonB-dependent receptor [Chitinophaga tropicalis]MVT09815.1 TonB-dependent receptor [Chitinophaga tropicalis]
MCTRKDLYISITLLCLSSRLLAQSDSSAKARELRGVEVKAVKLETLTSKAAMPVTIITRKTLDMMGSRRLDEVMREQTGIAIVNDIAAGSRAIGMQMQGFNSDYILILIDGQPMIGRNAGNFDLSRITVSDIERIEIVKGASSSLFGSEALGGVVNIITRQQVTTAQGVAILRYGTRNTQDATLEGELPFAKNKGAVSLSGNYYHTDGYNVNAYLSSGATAPPYDSYSLQARARYKLNNAHTLNVSGRWALRNSLNESVYGSGQTANSTKDVLKESDINSSIVLQSSLRKGWRLKSQYYLTRYHSGQDVSTGKQMQLKDNDFTQYFHRLEEQVGYTPSEKLSFIGGAGMNFEQMNDTEFSGAGDMRSEYAYVQGDWKFHNKWNARIGSRYDHHDYYGGRLNPSAGISFTASEKLTLKAAIGTGYKTPDFKKRYQVFTNPQAGYTVLGTEEVTATLAEMQAAGLISEIRPIAEDINASLRPETSVSCNVGMNYQPHQHLSVDVNVFYNSLHNFINTVQIATRTNYQPVYSYINIDRSYTAGVEGGVSLRPLKGLEVTAGYQLLYAKDRGIMDSIRAGGYPYNKIRNSNTGETRASRVSDYIGLENRSRHMINLRCFYEYAPWGVSATFRVSYRSKAGYDDANNNRFLDRYDTFIAGYSMLYASLEKKLFQSHLSIQVTADNLTNYTDMLMPGQPGRILMAGLKWRFFK